MVALVAGGKEFILLISSLATYLYLGVISWVLSYPRHGTIVTALELLEQKK